MWWNRVNPPADSCGEGDNGDNTGCWGEEDLAKEAEAFLSGAFARLLIHKHPSVPEWAWLNVVAHGTEAQIASFLAENAHGLSPVEQVWRDAMTFLDREVIATKRAVGCSLEELQRCVLVPLELEMATQPSVSPEQLLRLAFDALIDYERSRSRSR